MDPASTRPADGWRRRAFSAEDVRRMLETRILQEDERFELIEGDLVLLGRNPWAHELIRNALTVAMMRSASDKLCICVASTFQLAADILVDADIAVVRRAGYIPSESGFAQPSPTDILLVIEIAASGSSYERDIKSPIYARYGVQEFWVVDANERVTWVHTGPSDRGWSSIVERGSNENLTTPALPNFSMRLSDIG
jgi:Uma2 family endonuclease